MLVWCPGEVAGRSQQMASRLPGTINHSICAGCMSLNRVAPYIYVARPDHWFKNIFMLPGIALAVIFSAGDASFFSSSTVTALVSLCLLASANYTINEWLDAGYDRYHPVKKMRPSVTGDVKGSLIAVQYLVLAGTGLALARSLSVPYALVSLVFLGMGLVYNVPPVRARDRAYVDVLVEAINNPLRLILGWVAVLPDSLPPSSILLAYWMGGAFLMGVKRFAEYRYIDDPGRAALYRRSLGVYSLDSLLLSCFFYALCASFFLAIFLIKYRIEFLLSFPLFAALFTWYLALGMRADSPTQNPEKLFREPAFMIFLVCLIAVVTVLFIVDIEQLQILVSPLHYN